MKADSPRRVLARTALQVGGIPKLAAELKVTERTLRRYVLGEESRQIFASRYQLHLPSEAQLRAELERELERLDPPIGN